MKDIVRRTHVRQSWRVAALAIGIVSSSFALLSAQRGGAPAPPWTPTPANIEALKHDLVVANRVLASQGFLEESGHVSVRLDAKRFLMTWRRAPGLVVVDDVMEYDLEGNVTDTRNREPYSERFIHSEIYKARPDIRAVVHGHTESLVVFSSSNIPLRPVIAGARFLGDTLPAFANGDTGGGIGNAELGRGLAAAMGMQAAVLMRGHGVVVTAPDLVSLIGRSLDLAKNARMVSQLIAMRDTPIYLKGAAPATAGAAAPTRGPGGDASREWEAYERQTAVLLAANK